MITRRHLGVFFLLTLCFLQCENTSRKVEMFNQQAQRIQVQFAPDLSLNVFSATLKQENGAWLLEGETTVPEAKRKLTAFTDSLLGKDNYRDEFLVLPHPALGDSTYGLIRVSVAHLREEPRHAAQLVDQTIMGNSIRLLKNKGGWYLVQTEYGYIGWMRRESFIRTDSAGVERWKKSHLVQVTGLFPIIYSGPDENSLPVCDAVLNSLLEYQGKAGEWTKVQTPDGRTGFIQSKYVTHEVNQPPTREHLRERIIKTAKGMMGIPYLWGGNSSKGNDCSGFTQTVFKAHGIQLLRDARQQALQGEEVHPEENFSNVLPGDLLFFGSGDRITHVGISLGGA
ncbi:MAG: hypothetical protein D6748_13370, partial [Calditrichaeota bacterium]